jgi:arylsulfatase A
MRLKGKACFPTFCSQIALDRETLCWHYPHYHLGMPGGAIRDGKYKLIEYFETGELELYNLEEDPGEQRNLASELPGQGQCTSGETAVVEGIQPGTDAYPQSGL